MSNSLLPVGSSSLEHAVEASTARVVDFEMPLSSLWNPNTLPENGLPWLAWALSVDDWQSHWPESVKRDVVAASPGIHRMKGTAGAVRRALKNLGASVELKEWWQTGGEPYTAEMVAYAGVNLDPQNNTLLTPKMQQQLFDAVMRTKPARSQIDFKIGVAMTEEVSLASAVTSVCFHRQQHATQVPEQGFEPKSLVGGTIEPSRSVGRGKMQLENLCSISLNGKNGAIAHVCHGPSISINRITIGVF